MPNFSTILETLDEAEEFLNSRPDVPWKIMLFTNKRKTTALYKGLASEYRDRLDLAEIYDSAEEIVNKY